MKQDSADERLVTRSGTVVRVIYKGRDIFGEYVHVQYADGTESRLKPEQLKPLQ